MEEKNKCSISPVFKDDNNHLDPHARVRHPRQLGSPVKRARTEPLAFRPASATGGGNKGIAKKKLHTYAEPDILICGNCREVFPSLQKLLDHKRHRCRLRFTCRCHVVGHFPADSPPGIPLPVCAQCLARCGSWWELACHLEATHGMSIYHHPLEAATNSDEHDPKSLQSDQAMASPNNDGGCEEAASVASDCRSDDWASIVVECANHGSNGAHSSSDLTDEGVDKSHDDSPAGSSHDTFEKGVDTTDLQPIIAAEHT
ncbi:hypothetical protein MRX96_019258 [Rhipicephalus microplus]